MASFQVLNGKIMGGPVIPTESLKPLWINPDPEADFDEQNITFASGDYDLLLWIIRYSHDANAYEFSVIIEKGKGGLFETVVTTANEYITVHQRIARYISDTEYKIFAGSGQNSGSSRSTSNAYNIPVKVYGIKKNSIGGGDDDHLIKYSTNEQIVGTWIDGKPIYQKTITGTTGSNSDPIRIAIGASVDKAINISGFVNQDGAVWIPNNFWLNTISSNYVQGFKLAIFDNSQPDYPNTLVVTANVFAGMQNRPFYATIQYTKTTD